MSFVSHEVFLIFVKKVPFETDLLYCKYIDDIICQGHINAFYCANL